jgi:two-component system cell cycle sensor histidine kinase/response regulator CckA
MLKPLPEEQRLRAELERARGALAHMQEVARLGTWERDETTGIVEWSQGLESLLGFGPQTGRALETWLALVHPEDRARVAETIHAGVAHGPGYQYECRIRVGGEERLMHVDALTTRDAAGRPIRVNGIVQDITDWQRSEAALAQSEAVQSAVVDAALDSVVVMNAHGLVVEWNKAAESTFGWSRAEAVGQELAALIIPPAHRSAHRRALAAPGAEESRILGRRLELTALRRDGSEFPVEVAVGPVHGERPLFAGYLRDITERKRAEEARRAAESRWRALVEQIPAVTYLGRFDEEASMIYISPQVERLTGFAPERWTDDPGFWLSRVHPEDVESATRESEARFRERRGFSCTYRMRRADGAWIWIEEQSTILYDEEREPRHLQGVMIDVTERRRRDEELTAAQRLESIGQLAGGVAHDFNNLLGIIQGYAELLELEVPESSQSDVKEIRRAAERAADLTRQLLLFGRRESAEAGVVNANDVVAELRDMLQRTLGEHVDFVVDLAPAAGLVRMPAGQLEQILVNLVVNARDAMPGGGRLTVSTAIGEERVSLRVTDSGTGMTDDVATRAFDPFFTTKQKGRGTGLGLATVYGIVQGAGGRVWLDTVPGQGTTVEIDLPLAEEHPVSDDDGQAPPLAGRGETVLLVEDEGAVRELTGRILSENGYRVIDAADGYRARILCDQFQGEINLLISDVVMPGMSGRQVAEQLRSLRPALKVLYMSGHAGDVLDHHGFAGPEMPLLEKPFDSNRLLASVRAALS